MIGKQKSDGFKTYRFNSLLGEGCAEMCSGWEGFLLYALRNMLYVYMAHNPYLPFPGEGIALVLALLFLRKSIYTSTLPPSTTTTCPVV
jgi:hypothetical protein